MNLKAIAIMETLGVPIVEAIGDLGKGKVMVVPSKGRTTIYCLSGSLWATLEGKPEDILIKEGETRVIEGAGRLVVSALDESRLWVA